MFFRENDHGNVPDSSIQSGMSVYLNGSSSFPVYFHGELFALRLRCIDLLLKHSNPNHGTCCF